MIAYKPSAPFAVPLIVYKPTYTISGGVRKKNVPDLLMCDFEKTGQNLTLKKAPYAVNDGIVTILPFFQIFGTFRTFGGTELKVDGIYSIVDTAEIETWYRPDITSDCIIALAATGAKYEVFGEPENIGQRNQYLKFKVQRIKGGA